MCGERIFHSWNEELLDLTWHLNTLGSILKREGRFLFHKFLDSSAQLIHQLSHFNQWLHANLDTK